ncbi:hypothetical protein [Chromohalobacter moromii]|uniref:Uncharacterized protein n=1 Tax=Chromohalobacter moromii TaxID=2860329 RepID=A0A9X3B4V7_9GAMM|nr:hypothetical protein [Chromohalobacter moromii]MCK2047123.1 hypothetical protein [Chromohalobacter moromii]MCT8506700.1 hypothetical protein [Chromohalobacter moromii]
MDFIAVALSLLLIRLALHDDTPSQTPARRPHHYHYGPERLVHCQRRPPKPPTRCLHRYSLHKHKD